MSPCTKDDMDKFYPLASNSAKKVNTLQEASQLYCIDYEIAKDFELFGDWKSDFEYSVIEINLWPCATRYTSPDGKEHGGGENCNYNQTETVEYFGDAISTNFLYNNGLF